MRTLLPLLFLLALSDRDLETELRFAPAAGTVLERTFDAHAEYALTEVAMSVGDESIDPPDELPELTMDFREHVGVTDVLEAVEDGRPTTLERTFDSLYQKSVYSNGEDETESDSVSDLEGRVLRFTRDDDGWSIEAADDGDDPDSDLAEWLLEDMDLRAVLPPGEVEEGDEWEIGPELYLAFMWPGGLVCWHAEDDPQDDGTDLEMNAETIENLEGSGTVTLEELREEDGVRVAVLRVTLEIETSCDAEVEGEGGAYTVEIEIERSLEGTIVWDLDHGHALSAELEGTGSRLTTRNQTVETEDGELEIEQAELYEGTLSYSATFERQ